MTASVRIPCSQPAHWQAALAATDDVACRCADGHPLLHWRGAAGALLRPAGPDPRDVTDLVERLFVPVAYLCRFAHSLHTLGRLEPRGSGELKQALTDPDSFLHFEYMLHVAAKLAERDYPVDFVGRTGKKAPDIEVPSEQVAFEVRARGDKSPRKSLADDFTHAEEKFGVHLQRDDRRDWIGLLAVDLGVCGSPSLPDVARVGPNLSALSTELTSGLANADRVAGALVTWVGFERKKTDERDTIGPFGTSGWRMREGCDAPECLSSTFSSLERASGELARRGVSDRPDPRRSRRR